MGADERGGGVDTALPTPDPAWKLNLRPWDGEDEAVARLDATLKQRGLHIPLDAYSYIGRDFFLRRFLRARNLDVELAITMIQATISWREELGVTDILSRPLDRDKMDLMAKNFLSYYAGYDKKGNLVYVEHTAAVQFEVLQQHLSLDELIHAHVQLQEYQHLVAYDAACRRSGKRCLRTTNIMDFRGLGLSSFTTFVRDLVMRVSTVNQNHYPEGLEACYIVNAPWAFTAIFSFIRPFLAQTTLDKIKVLGFGEAMWTEVCEGVGEGFTMTYEQLCGDDVPKPDPTRLTCHQLSQQYVNSLTHANLCDKTDTAHS